MKKRIKEALDLGRNQNILAKSALVLALIGEETEANELIAEMNNDYSKDFVVNHLWIPCTNAVMGLENGNPDKALGAIKTAKQYEAAAEFLPQYLRGLAYLEIDENKQAVEEFQNILDHRGEAPLSVLYPLARLGKARATKNKKDYDSFFEIWQDADKDISVLIDAKKEYSNL